MFEKITQVALEQGLIVIGRSGTGTQIDGDHISIGPPFIITEPECDQLVSILESSFQQARQSLSLS